MISTSSTRHELVLSQNEVLVDVGLEQRIPVNMMGDGVRKILSLLTTIYECRDGVVLIDEISNGFHYSVMKDLWNTIVYFSTKSFISSQHLSNFARKKIGSGRWLFDDSNYWDLTRDSLRPLLDFLHNNFR